LIVLPVAAANTLEAQRNGAKNAHNRPQKSLVRFVP
jgi:hypothetical protein